MSERTAVLELVRSAENALERNRARIDDLNVYPVPDGDTGTNMLLTVRAVTETLQQTVAKSDRAELAQEVARAALLGARGNSGVILSQIARGAAEVLGAADRLDSGVVAAALRRASDEAYAAVREPVEGTILTAIRALADEAEAHKGLPLTDLLRELTRRGDEAVEQTREQLDILRQAGVVDAGAAGLVEIVRGLAAHLAGEPLPDVIEAEPLSAEAIHQEASRFRYCVVFVVEGQNLEAAALERELAPLGDSLLVVGDATALKAHVHTDDPGAALRAGTALGVIERVEIANMQVQTAQREERLARAPDIQRTTAVVAVVAGEGNRRLFESMGAAAIVDGGETMNPSTEALLDAIEGTRSAEAVVLANNDNVVLAARQAARLADKPVNVVPSGSLQAGLGAMLAYDPAAEAEANAAAMEEAAAAVATGSVTVASRTVSVDGLKVARGAYLGLAGGEPIAGGTSFDTVAGAVVERLLAEPRDILTFITGADEPELGPLLARVAERHPELELEVHPGGQPHYPLLIAAE
ncbi:MAG: DAK2 domain-containing protein [Actinobacteria bacterium]|nr:MAG: DAK2 domain-containing protein [Actinomycetota bacterium]